MKTVIDAVNEFKGEFPYLQGGKIIHSKNDNALNVGFVEYYGAGLNKALRNYYFVCTNDEFNECVWWMTNNSGRSTFEELRTWQKGIKMNNHYDAAERTLLHLGYTYAGGAEFWKPPLGKMNVKSVYTQEMADAGVMPGVGMECFVKKFHQDDSKYLGCYIIGYSQDKCWLVFEDEEDNLFYHDIKNGTFTFRPLLPLTPPIELIDGKAYQFDYNNGSEGMNDAVMRYRKSGDYFYFDNTIWKRQHCTNIQLLEVKSND